MTLHRKTLPETIFLLLLSLPTLLFAQLDARKIAADYYRGVVKILLVDSAAEKNLAGTGYIGRGSGFIVSEDGIIFTNRHVVDMCVQGYINYDYYDDQSGTLARNMETYSADILNDSDLVKINRVGYPAPIVQVYSGKGENDYKLYYAKVLTMSTGSFDGAMIQIVSDLNGNPAGNIFQPLPIGNSDSTFQGEDLCVYGYPENYSGGMTMMLEEMSTLTFGKHSGFDYAYSKDFGYIKTEASINKGNSGGPVFNQNNKVIGIATAAFNKTNIGLIGGVNAMYYVSAMRIDILQRLAGKGLKVPKNAGSIKTVTGDHQPMLSEKEIKDLNAKKQAAYDARIAKMQMEKEKLAYGAFASNTRPVKNVLINLGIYAGVSNYERGNLDAFWQNINGDPSLTATGNGNPFIWGADLQAYNTNKKEKNYWGFGLQFYTTSNHAIGAANQYQGVTNDVSLQLTLVNFSLGYMRAMGKKTFVLLEPSVVYMGYMSGKITAYGSTYNVSGGPFSAFGWQVAGGANYVVTQNIGISLRAGYRVLTLQEKHDDDRSGYSLSYSFFTNGVDGETTMIKWNGFYCTAGIIFSTASNIQSRKKQSMK